MRMTTVKRKPIACWPETNMEGGVESTSWGDARKDRQRTVGGKAGAEEITKKTQVNYLFSTKVLTFFFLT
jgi:hypothetical protein